MEQYVIVPLYVSIIILIVLAEVVHRKRVALQDKVLSDLKNKH